MQEFPHQYRASAAGATEGPIRASSAELPSLDTMPPPQYGGAPGYWSPSLRTASFSFSVAYNKHPGWSGRA